MADLLPERLRLDQMQYLLDLTPYRSYKMTPNYAMDFDRYHCHFHRLC